MPLNSDCSLGKMQVGNLAPDPHASKTEPACMEGEDSSANASSSGLFVSKTSSSSDESGSFLWGDIDRLSMSNDSRALNKKKNRRTVRGPLAALQTDTSEPRDVDSEARFKDWDGESYVYEPNGTFMGTRFNDGRSVIAPEDSISMKDVHRTPYEAASDDEGDNDESVCLATSRKNKHEDRLTKTGFVERLPDIDGKRHYRLELDIDKVLEEDIIRTELGTFNLSSSGLTILNSDGLHPKLLSDFETFDNGSLEIKKSPISGYGAFAVRDLEPDTTILIERELFSANTLDLYEKLEALTKEQVKAYHTLYGHMQASSEDIRTAIWRTNRFAVGRGGSVFLVASRFNHACKGRNNVDYAYDNAKKCMVFVTTDKVTAGSELFIRYGSDPQHLYMTWGFRCKCGACPGVTEDMCNVVEGTLWGQGQDDDWSSSN